MSPLEFSQYLFLVFMSWLAPSGDLYDAACLGTNLIFRGYHQGVCPPSRTWGDVQQSLDYEFYYPDSDVEGRSFPVVILVHGTSSAHTKTMYKRRQFFLKQEFAVLVPDSFTPMRVMAGLPVDKQNVYAPHTLEYSAFAGAEVYDVMFHSFQKRVTNGYAFLPAIRAPDLLVALDAARKNSRIDSSSIHIVGYSHGGSVVLDALMLMHLKKPFPGIKVLPDDNGLAGIRSATRKIACL